MVDCPVASLQAGEQGTVKFQVEVTEVGRAENCLVVGTSGSPGSIRLPVTKFVRRARFKPELDGIGKPIRSTLVTQMRWVLPAE